MGAPLETHHVAAVAAAIAEHGANIDRIRRLSRYPVTTVELDVSGADGTSRVLFYERGDDRARWVLT